MSTSLIYHEMKKTLFVILIIAYSNNLLCQNIIMVGAETSINTYLSLTSNINIVDNEFIPDASNEKVCYTLNYSFGAPLIFNFNNSNIGIESGFHFDNYKVPIRISSIGISSQTKYENPVFNLKSYELPIIFYFSLPTKHKLTNSFGIGAKYLFEFLALTKDKNSGPFILLSKTGQPNSIEYYKLLNGLSNSAFVLHVRHLLNYEFSKKFIFSFYYGIDLGLTKNICSGASIYSWGNYSNDNSATFFKGDALIFGLRLLYSFDI